MVIFQDQFTCEHCEEMAEKFKIKEQEIAQKIVSLLLANAYRAAQSAGL